MQLRSGFISSISFIPGMRDEGPISIWEMVARAGTRSTMRSFITGRLSGSMVIPSFASSMQASVGSPFTRTAQLPHCPDPQQ